jgi:hypothetical protein
MPDTRKPLYPEAKRGALSSNNEAYIHPRVAKGPKSDNLQSRIIIFGLIFIVVVALLLVLSFKLTDYFKPSNLNY